MLRRRHINLIIEHDISFCVDGTKDKVKSTRSLVFLITWAAVLGICVQTACACCQ